MLTLPVLVIAGLVAHDPSALNQADGEFARISYDSTVATCDTLLQLFPQNAEVLWRLARVNVAMGEVADHEHKEEYFRTAETYARRCIAADSTIEEGHTWLAAALGNVAMFEGSRTKVRLCGEIKRQLDEAIRLDPKDDIAWSILGSFYRALGNVSWFERQIASIFLGSLPDGGYEDADSALHEAIALAPRVLRHRFELALLYRDWGKDEEARAALDSAATMPVLMASDRRRLDLIHRMLSEEH